MSQPTFEPLAPKVVLGIAAHPDDLDFSSGGTFAKFAAEGAEVHYLILTDGGKGSEDRTISSPELTEIRHAEQQAALDIIGGKSVQFLDHPDGELEITMGLKKQIVRVIRQLKPDVVITMDPSMLYAVQIQGNFSFINHPDHRAAGQAALDAIFPLARDHLSFHDLFTDEHLEPHKVSTILLVNFEKHNYYVDITNSLETKIAAGIAHTSQIEGPEQLRGWQTDSAARIGGKCGLRYAEGFLRLDIH